MTGGWGLKLKLNTILSAALLLGSSVCFAFTEVGKIETVVNSRKIANLKLTAPIDDSVKNLFLGTKDKNCETKILKRDSMVLTVDISSCETVELKAGSIVYQIPEYSSDESPKQATGNSLADRIHRFGLGFRFNNKIRYGSAKLTSGSSTVTDVLEYSTSNTPMVFEWNFTSASKNSWGWGGGISFTSFTWDKATGGGITTNTTGSTNVLSPFINAVYRWDKIFIPFGLNISSLAHNGASTFMSANKGGLGGQLGVGIILNENFTLLIESKSFGFGGATLSEGSTSLDSGIGYSNGFNLIALFNF